MRSKDESRYPQRLNYKASSTVHGSLNSPLLRLKALSLLNIYRIFNKRFRHRIQLLSHGIIQLDI